MDESMTTMEYAAYRRIKHNISLKHFETTKYEKRSLGSLVKKGLVIKTEDGWTVEVNALKKED